MEDRVRREAPCSKQTPAGNRRLLETEARLGSESHEHCLRHGRQRRGRKIRCNAIEPNLECQPQQASPKNPSLGEVARSDGGRGAPGWVPNSMSNWSLELEAGPENP